MNEQSRPETGNSGSTSASGEPGWLDGVISGFMSEQLADAVDAAASTTSGAESLDPGRAWVAEGRAWIDETVAALLAPVIRKAMEEISDDVTTRLERIESRLESIERLLADR